jgi:hypothetical protein
MKPISVPLLLAIAVFGIARADNPPAPAKATTPATNAAAPASAGAPATPAAHTPVKAVKPWRLVTLHGKPAYCIDVMRQKSRIPETRCVDEQEYMREQSDSERARQNMMQGTSGCQPACSR